MKIFTIERLIFLSLSLGVVRFSCSKPLENKFRGTWMSENTRYPNEPKLGNDTTYWKFEGGTLTIRYSNDTSKVDSARYTFRRRGFSKYIVISSEKNSVALGQGSKDWFIVRLKKDQLRLAWGNVDKEGRARGLEQIDLIKVSD